jgi:hypothetical protein
MKNKLKKIIYLVLWVVAGILFAVVISGVIEIFSLWIYGRLESRVVLYGAMVVIGIMVGLILGPIAWQKIYIEGLRGKKYVVRETKG